MRYGSVPSQDVLRGLSAQRVRRWRVLIIAGMALAFGVVELFALNGFASREITWSYPIGFDQAYYGLQAFQVCDSFVKRGFVSTLMQYLANPNPQGRLLQFQGAMVFVSSWSRVATAAQHKLPLPFASSVIHVLCGLAYGWETAALGSVEPRASPRLGHNLLLGRWRHGLPARLSGALSLRHVHSGHSSFRGVHISAVEVSRLAESPLHWSPCGRSASPT